VYVSSSAARRAATVTFVLDVETGVMSASSVQTSVANGVTANNLITQMNAIVTATNWNVTVPTAADVTVATATFAGAATSSATMAIPSALVVLLSIVMHLFGNFGH